VTPETRARLSQTQALMRLHDLDMLLKDARDAAAQAALKKMGFKMSGLEQLERARAELVSLIDRRWILLYDRALKRYGRAVAPVKGRVCLGCFVTLPTSAVPPPADSDAVSVCQSCSRILYWIG
jgi:predicted  nucleic acid-binding Zn-ribbon protein